MIALKWENKYSVGDEILDEQHKQWFKLLNDIREAIKVGQTNNILAECIQRLDDYSAHHFKTEEKYMEENQFPYLEEHKHQHEEFLTKLSSFKVDFDPEKSLSAFNILEFLINWISFHVLESDKEYASYIRRKKKKLSN
jgi:hemerythrin-like metal-binding protein